MHAPTHLMSQLPSTAASPTPLEAGSAGRQRQLPDYLCHIVTPLKRHWWQAELQDHPDQEFAVGNRGRFPNWLQHQVSPAKVAKIQHAFSLRAARGGQEIPRGGSGCKTSDQGGGLGCGGFGSPLQPVWRDPQEEQHQVEAHSRPISVRGHSVNDGITKELASLTYMSIDDVVAWVLDLYRCSTPIWSEVCPVDFLGFSRCGAVDDAEEGCQASGPLYR